MIDDRRAVVPRRRRRRRCFWHRDARLTPVSAGSRVSHGARVNGVISRRARAKLRAPRGNGTLRDRLIRGGPFLAFFRVFLLTCLGDGKSFGLVFVGEKGDFLGFDGSEFGVMVIKFDLFGFCSGNLIEVFYCCLSVCRMEM